MSKLPKEHKFIDLSDYGRPIAQIIVNQLKETRFTAIHVTIWFIIAGLIAIYFILNQQFTLAAVFLILKSLSLNVQALFKIKLVVIDTDIPIIVACKYHISVIPPANKNEIK